MKTYGYIISIIGGGMVGGFAAYGGIIGLSGALAGMALVIVGTKIISTT
jgi:hypothetical protein